MKKNIKNSKDLDDIIEFTVKNGDGHYSKLDVNEFIKALKDHAKYGTIMVVRDEKGVAATARWNWVDKETVKILDCIVRKDLRRVKMLKYLIKLGFSKNLTAKYITYDRYYKYPYRKPKKIKVGG